MTHAVLRAVFDALDAQGAILEVMVLKPNMVLAGIPWPLVFSFGRALQQPAIRIWRGQAANVVAGQRAMIRRANCSGAALHGSYLASMEDEPALRMAS